MEAHHIPDNSNSSPSGEGEASIDEPREVKEEGFEPATGTSDPGGTPSASDDEEQAHKDVPTSQQSLAARTTEKIKKNITTTQHVAPEAALEQLLIDRGEGRISRAEYRSQKNVLVKELQQQAHTRPQPPHRQDIFQAAQSPIPAPSVKPEQAASSEKKAMFRSSRTSSTRRDPEPSLKLLPTYGIHHAWGVGVLIGAGAIIALTFLWLSTPLA